MGRTALCLLASLWSDAVLSTSAQTCNYIMDNYCNSALMTYECVPPATTCCYHLEFTDSSCKCRKAQLGNVTNSDNYIDGSCRTESASVQDTSQCQQKPPAPYYMKMTVSGAGSTLKYCTETFSDASCSISKGDKDKDCLSKDPTLGRSVKKINGVDHAPLDVCFPQESSFKMITCQACTAPPPPYDPPNPSACPRGTTASSAGPDRVSAVFIFSIIIMAAQLDSTLLHD
jgi:hypothetical protein